MTFVIRHPMLALRILFLFVPWYLKEMPVRIVRTYLAYAHAFGEMFSFSFMLWTLFEPWKSITDSYDMRGLNLELLAETFFLNLTTRAIGFLFRIVAICIGLVVQALAIAACVACLVVWYAYPVLLLLGIRSLLAI